MVRALGAAGAAARVSGLFAGSPRWGRVLDAAPRGLALLLPAPFEAGTELYVELHGPGQRLPHPALARVARATARPDGTFLVGCVLRRPLPAGVLHALTGTAAP